jgi:putative oxidoreductase
MFLIDLNYLTLLKIFSGLVFSVLFLQSGFDKIIDYKGNKDWIISYFESTPLNKSAKLLFIVLTLTEVLAGVFSFLGVGMLLLDKGDYFTRLGIAFSFVALLFVFTGQRLAKDYASAANTIAYIAAAILAGSIAAQ